MLKAIFFDQDGVIVDTEKDGHRVAFNRTFHEFGIRAEWDVATYGELLKIGGGKERMAAWFKEHGTGIPVRPEEVSDLIARIHLRKTALFVELIQNGTLPARPGILRLMKQANERGIRIGICTTSNEKAATAIAQTLLKDVRIDFILAGDIVTHKKPDPEIYLSALDRTGLTAGECMVIEDSRNGVAAARAAGLHVLATVNEYTKREDLSAADAVVTCLGDPPGCPAVLLRGPAATLDSGRVDVDTLGRLLP
jgi:HAD superfamily hydrolase (TIGR01509 family)